MTPPYGPEGPQDYFVRGRVEKKKFKGRITLLKGRSAHRPLSCEGEMGSTGPRATGSQDYFVRGGRTNSYCRAGVALEKTQEQSVLD